MLHSLKMERYVENGLELRGQPHRQRGYGENKTSCFYFFDVGRHFQCNRQNG